MSFYKNKKVLVAGGGGFVGSFLVEKLIENGAVVRVCDIQEKNKLEKLKNVIDCIEYFQLSLSDKKNAALAVKDIDYVFALSAVVGGVKYNSEHPGYLFYNNISANLELLEAARLEQVKKYLCVSSACVYPADAIVPTPESEGFKKEPEYTNRGYGWSKRVLELQAMFYRQEYGMDIAIARPFNIYGPRDNFSLEKSHVIPALIQKVANAEYEIEVWGTGTPTRSFVYVEDIVAGMLLVLNKSSDAVPINIGVDEEISIINLVKLIIDIYGKKLKIKMLADKPDGQPRRNCDNTKIKNFGFTPKYTLTEGLKKTIEWYKESYGK